jgi:zinc/manganese transport system substrate-binding protein
MKLIRLRFPPFLVATVACLAVGSPAAHAQLKVLTTLPDLAFLAREIAGPRAEVDSLLSGLENPHFVDARPDLIRKVASADIVCAVGMELEAGWLPRVLQKSGNARIQNGGQGFCELFTSVTILQKPTGPVDRSMGDIHPNGNPHFWISPIALAEAGTKLVQVLSANDPEGRAVFEANLASFTERMKKLVAEWKPRVQEAVQKNISKLGPAPVIEYHQEFTYLFQIYGIRSFGSIEERPGVPPSAQRLGQISLQAKAAKVGLALSAPYAPLSLIHKFTELSGIAHITLPTSTERKKQFNYEQTHREAMAALIRGLHGDVPHP